jgi:2-methylisocitrate lyase-like PEP mutase family enzyme
MVEAVGLPLNVLAWPGLPDLAELRALGVRRLSAGSGVALVAANHARVAASAFLRGGQLPRSAEPTLSTREMNGLFANR